MDFTTSTRVKEALVISGSGSDTFIAQAITAVSGDLERVMDRHAQQTARTETYAVKYTKNFLLLRGYPLDTGAALTVKVSQTLDFTDSDALTEDEDYTCDPVTGELRLLEEYEPRRNPYSGMPIAPIQVQVTYTGGMATNTAGIISAFPELAQACDMQVVHLFKRRSMPGATSAQTGTSDISYTGELGLLSGVLATAKRFRRLTW